MKLAVLIANRGFFPSTVIDSARAEMTAAVEKAGAQALLMDSSLTRYGAVETRAEGEIFAKFLKENDGEYDGLIICLPNFGDENGIKEAIKDVNVPILLQAYPDELDKLDFASRRDAFCGKLGLCAVLKQMKTKFVNTKSFVVHPSSDEFNGELKQFIAICRIVKRMKHMRIGVLLDTYHMNIEEDNIGDAIRIVGDRLTSFHTGDNNRRAPGRGHIDWDEVFKALSDINYKGRIDSEPFVMQGGEVGRDIHVYRDLIENPTEAAIDAEAKYLIEFEKAMLRKYNMA